LTATNSFTVVVNSVAPLPQPAIQSITISNGIVTITWTAVAGHSYAIERKDDLNSTNWIQLLPAASAIGPTATATDVVGDAIQRLYRVVVHP